MANIQVRLRDIADDLAMGCPAEVMDLAAQDLYRFADELDLGNSTNRRQIMNPLLSESIGSIVRWALNLAVPILVTSGIWTPEDATKYVAAASAAILALAWSLYNKHAKEEEIQKALQAPAGTSREMLSRSL